MKSDDSWSQTRFGTEADDLREKIAGASTDAYLGARDAQDASGAATNDPYGHTLKVLQFQLLAETVGQLPAARTIKLDRYPLVIIAGCVLYPARSLDHKTTRAKEGRLRVPVSTIRRRLFAALGAKSAKPALAPSLEPPEPSVQDLRTLLARLGAGTHLVAISYIASLAAGITDIYWGDAELRTDDGSLIFHDGEPIPIIRRENRLNHSRLRAVSAESIGTSVAFDQGHPPELQLSKKPPLEAPIHEAEPPFEILSDEEE